MKRLILLMIVVVMLMTSIMGCGNMSLGLGNFTFTKVHVDMHHFSGCFTIEKWYDSDTGIEVLTEEAGSMYLSEGTYVLLDGSKPCPFCSAN